jgi:D-3-phosphoglycerate dehydrogenase / 2-oxoglutarate reductase
MEARILVCDDVSSVGLGVLRHHGYRVIARPGIPADDLPAIVGDVDALLVRSRTHVTKEVLDAAPRLRVIGRAGFGMDRIDVDEATRRGIVVLHSPEGNAITAAEFTIGLLFSLARHIPKAYSAMRQGRWEKRRYRGFELTGKTLGVIGMGEVGSNVVQRAVGLGMVVKVHDPGLSRQQIAAMGAMAVSWDELLSTCDFISPHVPSSPLTRGLLGPEAFERMKDGVRIINCNRGGIIDEQALVRAIRRGRVAGAAVDNFDEEPPWGNELLEMEQVIVTPHLMVSTFEAQIRVAVNLAEQIRDFFEGREVRAVNPEALERARES